MLRISKGFGFPLVPFEFYPERVGRSFCVLADVDAEIVGLLRGSTAVEVKFCCCHRLKNFPTIPLWNRTCNIYLRNLRK